MNASDQVEPGDRAERATPPEVQSRTNTASRSGARLRGATQNRRTIQNRGVLAIFVTGCTLASLTACSRDADRTVTSVGTSASISTLAPSATTSGQTTTRTSRRATPSEALRDASAFMAAQYDRIDAASLTIVDFVGRRYGIAGLAGAGDAARTRFARPDITADERALARLVDPNAALLAPIGTPEARTTDALASAVHCDRQPLPPTYLTDLAALASGGGYDATHAALAVGWLEELGCASAASDELRQRLVSSIEAEWRAGDGLVDLRAEQSAFAIYLGGTLTIDAAWSQAILDNQRPDGGWGQNGPSSESSWHTTILAMWSLAAQDPANNTGPMSQVPMLSFVAGR